MQKKYNRGALVSGLVLLMLVILACTCGPLSGVTDAGTAIAGITPGAGTGGSDTGAGECATSTAGTPQGYSGTIETGGDSYTTTLIDTIALGETKTACLASSFDAHNWLFEGTAGQTITIRVIATTEADPRLKVIGPDGSVIDEADDTENLNPILTLTLPANGTYTFRIDTFTNGEYSITVQ